MDRNVWKQISRAVRSAERRIAPRGRTPVYRDRLIVLMYFWSVWHDRPLCWACARGHYSALFRPRRLPSVSQFCRRVKTARIEAMIRLVNERLARDPASSTLAFIDGKALPVSETSRDPDARTGRGNGKFSRGYKMHALASEHGRITAFRVHPMNAAEPRVTREELVTHVPPGLIVLADGNYDSRFLYQAIEERGSRFFTPQKKNARSEAAIRKTVPARRAAIEYWRDHPRLARRLYRLRGKIERIFSALTTFGGGLGPLPTWVRRMERVERWITAKLAIYHARLIVREAVA